MTMTFPQTLATTMLFLTFASVAHAQACAAPFTLSTDAFEDGGTIPVRFSQAAPGAAPGEGTSPALSWQNAPEGTQSFVLHMHDLDVARNRSTESQLHWLVWNVPASANGFAEGLPRGSRLPDGSYQTSATGPVYRGPGAPATRPPHHYLFELYALDTMLDVEPSEDAFETRGRVLEAMQGHVVGKAVYMGRFRRPE
jgi:Raf kinase inhibitor-like YbhB/YbcL family protein